MEGSFDSVPGKGVPFVSSWSGGKDSCLALYRSIVSGAGPACLLTMLHENGERSRAHGIHRRVLSAQASCLGIPLVTRAATWALYEEVFSAALGGLGSAGMKAAVFGDIDLDGHLEWERKVCATAGLEPFLPLWRTPRLSLLEEFLSLGFKAMIITVREGAVDRECLGRILDRDLVVELERTGIDPSGEEGEYHTLVIDGPIFSRPLRLKPGRIISRSGYLAMDVSEKSN
jgi:uncharacterized protein (TIGR00290 family)